MAGGAALDSLIESLIAALGGARRNLEIVEERLPGGVAGPDRSADEAVIADLAELIVLQTGKQRDEEFLGLVAAVKAVLKTIASFMYDAGYESMVDGLRLWLNLAPDEPGVYGDIAERLSTALGVGRVDTYLGAIRASLDMSDSERELLVGADEDVIEEGVGPSVGAVVGSDMWMNEMALGTTGWAVPQAIKDLAASWQQQMDKADAPRKTSSDGNFAHTALQLHYLISHPGNRVILGPYVAGPTLVPGGWTTLINVDGSPFDFLRSALVRATGKLAEPDILDDTLREVYEIKPLSRWASGLTQLYGRYLLPLNASLLGTQIAAALLNAQTPVGGMPTVPGMPAGVTPYLPGHTWRPSPFYVLPPNRLMVAARPVPGLLLYEIFAVQARGEANIWYEDLVSEYLALGVLAMAVAVLAVTAPATAPAAAVGAVAAGAGTAAPLGLAGILEIILGVTAGTLIPAAL